MAVLPFRRTGREQVRAEAETMAVTGRATEAWKHANALVEQARGLRLALELRALDQNADARLMAAIKQINAAVAQAHAELNRLGVTPPLAAG